MLLPTKHIPEQRALLTVASDILGLLTSSKTTSRIWTELQLIRSSENDRLNFDWFVLALDFLYSINAIDVTEGLLHKRHAPSSI